MSYGKQRAENTAVADGCSYFDFHIDCHTIAERRSAGLTSTSLANARRCYPDNGRHRHDSLGQLFAITSDVRTGASIVLQAKIHDNPPRVDKQLGGSILAESQHPAHKKIKWRSAEAGKS